MCPCVVVTKQTEFVFLPFKVKPLTKVATETFTEAQDVLKNEENMFIVWVIPTIKLLNEKNCIPLVFAIHTGLNVRYLHLSKPNHLIIPLVSDPIFKMIWVEDNNKNEYNKLIHGFVRRLKVTRAG